MSHNKELWKKFALLVLCLGLAMGTVSAAGEPAADAAAEITETMTETAAETGDAPPEELSDDAGGTEQVHAETGALTPAISDQQAAAGFISQLMTGRELTPPKPRGTLGGARLTGREARMYAALKTKIREVATGQLSDTNFRIPVRDIYENWVYADTSELNIDFALVVRALLYDLPYDLYWFDKTAGYGWVTPAYVVRDSSIYLSDYGTGTMSVQFKVSADYAESRKPGTTSFDKSFGTRAVRAAANARRVVESNLGKSDMLKLQAYKDYICGAVDYDYAAVYSTPYYGDPWQLVNVFDDDPSTRVVCEGYSKAFQFLCDESIFQGGVSVVSVTGTMSGGTGAGGHMWNLVRMPDGRHYMADITNSDSNAVGYQGDLFLKGYFTWTPSQNRYTYLAGGTSQISYTYDGTTLLLLNASGMLAMSGTDYAPTAADYVDSGSTLILPDNLKRIQEEAFAGTDVRNIVIPASCTFADAKAFADCEALEQVIVMNADMMMSVSAFDGCDHPITLRVPRGSMLATILSGNSKVTVVYLEN